MVEGGHRVIRPDQRGYSPAARPREPSQYRIGHLVEDAVGLLDALGIERCHVIGHDWGGVVAWGLASRHADRVLSLVVLSTPHPKAIVDVLMRSRQLTMSWYMAILQWPWLAERVIAPGRVAWPALMRGLPRDARHRYQQRASDLDAFRAMIDWYRGMALDLLQPSLIWEPVLTPTLYAWGMRDPALGLAAAQRTAAYVAGPFALVELARHGHWLPERAAAELVPLVLDHMRAASDRNT
jgi:pimeloyl-ACP methyl ester carboxylesterase